MKWVGIRSCLFVIMSVLTAIPVLWLGNKLATHLTEEVRRSNGESLAIAARGVSWQMDQLVQARTRDLETFTIAVEALGAFEGPAAERLLETHWHRSGYYQGMYVADTNANVLVRMPRFAPGELPHAANNYSDRDYYKQLMASRQTAVATTHIGKALGKPGLQMAAPIFDSEHTLMGFVEGTASLEPLIELVKLYSKELPESRVVLLDSAGHIVADSAQAVNPELVVDAAIAKKQAELAAQPADSDFYTAQTSVNSLRDWRVVASLPREHVEQIARQNRNHVWMASGLVWLVSLALSGLIAHGFGRRFSGLADTVQALGEGDFSRRPSPPRAWEPAEICILVSQVNSMAVRLDQHTTDLERLVKERTSELAKVNHRLQVLVNALERAGDGIEISDPEGCYLYVNPALERITGYASSELLGQMAYTEGLYERILPTIRSGNVYSGSFLSKRKDGTSYDQEVTVWPVFDVEGELTHVVGLRRDISERKKTEHALRVSERMASVGTLAAGVAHEINNPLTYVLLSLRLIERELLGKPAGAPAQFTERATNAVVQAIEGAERVQAIVKDLRTFSRASDDSVGAIEVKTVLDSALRMVANDIRHRARLRVDHQPTPQVLGNPSRLIQVLLNLLVNAVHSLDEGNALTDEIVVSSRADEAGNAVIQVKDTGAGIAKENLVRVFDPFFTTKPVGEGTGLGLSMCHNIVTSMHGTIAVNSTLGVGTTFTIVLPAVPRSLLAPELVTASHRIAGVSPRSILVIDDDRAVAAALRDALPVHAVEIVHSASAALAKLERHKFDVILCDVMMPGTNGLELYAQLCQRGHGEEARVVFITGGALTPAARTFLDQPEILYLEKPISEGALEQAIRRVCERRAAPATAVS